MQATPATWRLLLEAGWTGSPRMTILCGGEAWYSTLAEELLPRCESLWNMYGPTETAIWSAVSRVEAGKSVLIGAPIANTTFYILDHCKELVPIGVPGELYIGGSGLAQGYLNRPDLTDERFVSDPFSSKPDARLYRTGDLVRRVSDGRIEFLSRLDNQVKVRGFRIELGEIEACLRQYPDIEQCAVVAQEQKEGDRRLVAYIVHSGTSSALSAAKLRTFLKRKLPEYMLPAAYARLESMPLTPNGKINHKALAPSNRSIVDLDSAEESIAPSSLLELSLLTIWERVLGISGISIRDNFFDIGGHSLQIIRLISEINRSLNASLTTQVFFLKPTIQSLARVILEGNYVKPAPHLIMLRQNQSHGALFLINAPLDMCRLGGLLDVGPSVFATEVPLSSAHYGAAVLNKTSSMPCMEELAAAHVTLIRSQQFSGPCLLAGNSFSGLLAFEVAQRLVREGRSVEMLLILDSLLVLPPISYRLKQLSGERARSALSRRLVRLWRWLMESRAPKYDSPAPSAECRRDLVSDEAVRPLDDVPFDVLKNIYNNIFDHYRLRPLETHGTLFLARDQHDLGSRLRQTLPNLAKIQRLFKQTVELVEVPGEHLTMLKEPHIHTLAKEIEKRVAKLPAPNLLTIP
jgi:thioesterase domain-containing protein